MKRQIVFPLAILALMGSEAARAQDDGGFCANVTQITRAAREAKPFGSVIEANGAGKLKPVAEFRDCAFRDGDPRSYNCFLPIPAEEQMETFHGGLGAMLQECLGVAPEAEQLEPALMATGKLPYLSFEAVDDKVYVTLYPRQDWGEYADEAWDEEFTNFGFDLRVTTY